MINERMETNKIFFRRIILLMVFSVILTGLIPSVFDFEKYYGISRFINPGYTSVILEGKFELYATIFMCFFSLISLNLWIVLIISRYDDYKLAGELGVTLAEEIIQIQGAQFDKIVIDKLASKIFC